MHLFQFSIQADVPGVSDVPSLFEYTCLLQGIKVPVLCMQRNILADNLHVLSQTVFNIKHAYKYAKCFICPEKGIRFE